jgi:hypothetical protein
MIGGLVKNLRWLLACAGCFLLSGYVRGKNPPFKFEKMLVEYAEEPINIDASHPRFSWVIVSAERNQVQTAYQLLVATSIALLSRNQPDVWNWGTISLNPTVFIIGK